MQPVINSAATDIQKFQTPPKPRHKVVGNDLKEASNIEKLISIWKANKEHFNSYNIATFVNRFYKFKAVNEEMKSDAKAVFHEVMKRAENHIQEFDTDGLSILCEALGHMKISNRSLLSAIKNQLLKDNQAELKACSAKCLAMLAKASCVLETDTGFLLAIIDRFLQDDTLLTQAKPQELCYVAHACIYCEDVPGQFYQKLDEHIRTRRSLDIFAPWQLAMLAYAISVRETYCQPLLAEIAKYLIAQPQKTIELLDAEDLGRIKHAMMKLYQRPQKLLELLAKELLKDRTLRLQYRSAAWLTRCVESYNGLTECPESVLQRVKSNIKIVFLSSRDLVYAISGFSNAAKPDEKLLVDMKQELFTAHKARYLHGQDLVLVARYVEQFLPQLQQQLTREKLEKMTPRQLADLSFALSSWKETPTELVKEIASAACKKIAECSVQDLAEIASIMKRLVKDESREFFSTLQNALLMRDPAELEQFDAIYGLMLAQACTIGCEGSTPLLKWLENMPIQKLNRNDLTQLATLFANHQEPEFACRLDGVLFDSFSSLSVWSQTEWMLALQASLSLAKSAASKTVTMFLQRLETELQEQQLQLSMEMMIRRMFSLLSDDVDLDEPVDISKSLELTDSFCEKLFALYLQCPDGLFSGEVKMLVDEIREERCRKIDANWEGERTL